jgi:hypothetical protein
MGAVVGRTLDALLKLIVAVLFASASTGYYFLVYLPQRDARLDAERLQEKQRADVERLQEKQRADAEKQRADAEKQRADAELFQEKQRADAAKVAKELQTGRESGRRTKSI